MNPIFNIQEKQKQKRPGRDLHPRKMVLQTIP